jgi:hypothetical protein
MADQVYNEVVMSVPDTFAYLEEKKRIGFFPSAGLFGDDENGGILDNNGSKVGGANVRLKVTVNAPVSTGGTSNYIARTNAKGNVSASLTFEYYKRHVEMTISKSEVQEITSGPAGLSSFVEDKVMGVTTQQQIDIETAFWTNTDMTTEGGPKGWLSGATYGTVTRADTTTFGSDAAVSMTKVLGTGTAYDYSANWGITDPLRTETYWDVSTAYSAAVDQGEFILEVIGQLQLHIDRPVPKGHITHICMGKKLGGQLIGYMNRKPLAAANYGSQKSMTASDGFGKFLINGAKLYISELIGATDIFLINKDYTYVPALNGYNPKKWSSEQGPSPCYVQATAFTYVCSFKFCTDAPIMHGWLAF